MSLICKETIDKLFSSLDDLDEAITSAKKILVAKNASSNLLERIDSYSEILKKQRALANTLTQKIETNETESITRIVSIISGLSYMLRDDTREVLASECLSGAKKNISINSEKQTYSKQQIC